jgi:hypothetical protein
MFVPLTLVATMTNCDSAPSETLNESSVDTKGDTDDGAPPTTVTLMSLASA